MYKYSCIIDDLLFILYLMSLFIASLNSGSNGNCYYIGNKNDAILIDAGISCRTIESRLKDMEIPMSRIRAVFISHEHIDHIKGVETLAKKWELPVYISEKTLANCSLSLHQPSVQYFGHGDVFTIGDIKVHAFSKIHDAADPYSFFVTDGIINIGVFTDIGQCCENVTGWFSKCHAAFLETNYDEAMLDDGPYPYHLKKRIAGGRGHLSNTIAHQLFTKYRPAWMSHLILAHLSNNNNEPNIVRELFNRDSGEVQVLVASRKEATPLIEVTGNTAPVEKLITWKQTILQFDR